MSKQESSKRELSDKQEPKFQILTSKQETMSRPELKLQSLTSRQELKL